MVVHAKQVEIIPIEENLGGELAKEVYYECDFCRKRIPLQTFARNFCEKLSGENYYCNFCLRHSFHTKNNNNVLIFTFRTIIGHYYQEFYINATPTAKMYFVEIQEYIDSHMRAGLFNPIFAYDTETFLWYADFSRVGRGNKKLKFNDVLKSVINILACFNLKTNIPNMSIHTFYEKYREAMYKFYTARYRPADKPILAPTLFSTNSNFRSFTSDLFLPNLY